VSGVELPSEAKLGELAARFGGALDAGAEACVVRRVTTPEDAHDATDLAVLTQAAHTAAARNAPGAVLCIDRLAARLERRRRWIHSQPMWVVAKLLEPRAWRPPLPAPERAAYVAEGAVLGPGVVLGAGAVVHGGARIGRDSRIAENAVIYPSVELGQRVSIGPGSVIGRPGFGWIEGPAGELQRIPQLGGVVIEDDVEIGAVCTVDAGTFGPTRIRRDTKLDAHVHVGHNVELGPGALVAAQAGFAGSSRIGAGVLVGGQTGVADHVTVGQGARLAAKSGVIGDVPAGATVAGFPAVPRIRWLRAMAALFGRAGRER
jgi:UDP-3-O-[3-hydroxymyristoyl] glucosamine N-acyltransferase